MTTILRSILYYISFIFFSLRYVFFLPTLRMAALGIWGVKITTHICGAREISVANKSAVWWRAGNEGWKSRRIYAALGKSALQTRALYRGAREMRGENHDAYMLLSGNGEWKSQRIYAALEKSTFIYTPDSNSIKSICNSNCRFFNLYYRYLIQLEIYLIGII